MAEYLLLAEGVFFKNNKLTCINIYDKLSTVAMPAEFKFDLAILCGPDWSVGEHKLVIKARANNGKEVSIGDLSVQIPSKDFVYNAYANDLKVVMDYSVSDFTIVVEDNGKEIITRKYPVVSMFVPQQKTQNAPASGKTKEKKSKKNK